LFGSQIPKPAETGEDGDGEDGNANPEEYEPQVDFRSLVVLQEVEVKTEEEDEEVLFKERCKLFRYSSDTKEWKEKGVGEIKILIHKETSAHRVLMRRDQVLKLCANHRILPEIKLELANEKQIRWSTNDYSENEAKHEILLAKFRHEDEALENFENLRKSLSEINTKYALSESKLEGMVEKCKTLNATVEKYKKECEILKEKNSKFSELIVKHEQSITTINLELHKANEKKAELEANLRNVTIERDLFKSNQERLSIENQILTRENQSRSLILQNLETIKNSCDRNERENKIMYHDKIEGLEKENTIMRKRLETDEEQKKLIQKSFETQLNNRLDSELKEREKTREQLRKVQEDYDLTRSKLVEVEAKLHTSEQLIQMTRNAKSSTTISRLTELEEHTKDLQMKLSLSEKEIVSLKIQLEDTKSHAKQYSTIADNMEKTYRESSEANEKSKKILEDRINQLETEKSSIQNDYNNLNFVKISVEAELKAEKEKNENHLKTLNIEYTNTMKELNEIREKLNQTEIILFERTKDRDAYVSQIRILEDQIKEEINEN